ncbi:hypothetical protein ACROYT_G016873, partial [Oculina patagonica]
MNRQEKQVFDKDFKDGVIQTLDELRTSNVLCDVTIRAEGQDFPAHRCVLSAGSPYFRALFTSELRVRENEDNLIKLTEITSEAFTEVLQYIYTGKAKIDSSNVQGLIIAADYLIIPSLKSNASLFLEESINVSNCLALESFATQYSCESLKQAAVSYFRENFLAVAKSRDFQSLDLQKVKELLCDDKVNVSQEEEVYEAMIRWVKHDLESRECALPELLKCVRLFSMSKYSLRQIIEEEELVMKSPNCMSIVVCGLDYSLFPDQFQSTSLTPRFSLGGYENVVVLTGGMNANNQSTNNTLCFVLSTKKWLLLPAMPDSFTDHDAAVCGGILYVVGMRIIFGLNSMISSFNPKQKKWNSIEKSNRISKGCSVTTFNEMLFVTGGEYNLNRALIYNPVLDEWKEVAPMKTGRAGHCSVVLQKQIYVIAGHNSNTCHNSVECYNPSTDQWKTIPSISNPRRFAAAATSRGKIVVVGGYSDMSDSLTTEASCETFDPSTNEWSLVTSPAFPRAACGIVSMDDIIYLVGGRNEK